MAFNPREQLEKWLPSDLLQDVLRAQESSPLSPKAPLFFHLTYWAASRFNADILRADPEEFQRFLQRAIEFVNTFAATQSTTQLQQSKRAFFEAISGTEGFQGISLEQKIWYRKLSEVLGLFPDRQELERLIQGEDPERVWQEYEVLASIEDRPPKEKIISLEKAVTLSNQLQGKGLRVGLNIGKYRLGDAHKEYKSTLSDAKTFLAPEALFLSELNQELQLRGASPVNQLRQPSLLAMTIDSNKLPSYRPITFF